VVVLACRVAAFDHSLALRVVEKVMQPPFSGSHSDLVNLARPFKAGLRSIVANAAEEVAFITQRPSTPGMPRDISESHSDG
jgi:hypothetical protein